MTQVNRTHLAGLEIYKRLHGEDIDYMLREDLDKLIERARSEPAQGPVAFRFKWDFDHGNGWSRGTTRFVEDMDSVSHEDQSTWCDMTPLYTHADDSELERLRAELEKCFTVEDHERLVAKGQELNSAYISKLEQRLAEADQKISTVVKYVQGMVKAAGNQPSVATGYLRDILEALLSTTALSAEDKPDEPN